MIERFLEKISRYREFIFLIVVLCIVAIIVLGFGDILMPVLIALVIAYVLDVIIQFLIRQGMPELVATIVITLLFLVGLVLFAVIILPLLVTQVTSLISMMPDWIGRFSTGVKHFASHYPALFGRARIDNYVDLMTNNVAGFYNTALSWSLKWIRAFSYVLMYLIIVPVMVILMLFEKKRFLRWLDMILPSYRGLANDVWQTVNNQLSRYMVAKLWEIVLTWVTVYLGLLYFGLDYALLLSFLAGVSCLVPFVGTIVTTIPIIIVAYFQFDIGYTFYALLATYVIIIFIDSNIIVPLLFAGFVTLSPLAIFIAIIFFGGLWGMLGVLFAIPMATLLNAVLTSWLNSRKQLGQKQLTLGSNKTKNTAD